MNANQNIHDILKEAIELLKDTKNLTMQHDVIYHQTYDGDQIIRVASFKEVQCGGAFPGVLVEEQFPTSFDVVIFDPELLNAYDEAQKALSITK